jgi:hypothetical protein
MLICHFWHSKCIGLFCTGPFARWRGLMTSDMAFECLLVSRDASVVGVMNRLLDKLSICTSLCLTTSKAVERFSVSSTDLVIVDWQSDSEDLVRKIYEINPWQKPTVMAVSNIDSKVTGAHVVLHKPVSDKAGAKSLKTAYRRMLYDHRRHTRYAVMKAIKATDKSNRLLDMTVTNIGDGGVGLSSREEFLVGDLLSFRLVLPGCEKAIYIDARVQWTREYGALGCEFVRIPPVDLTILHDWLRSKSQIKKPVGDI